jgi:hypothetical protein
LPPADVQWGCPACGAEFTESTLADVADLAEAVLRVAAPPPLPLPQPEAVPETQVDMAGDDATSVAAVPSGAPEAAGGVDAPELAAPGDNVAADERVAEIDPAEVESVDETVEPPPLEAPRGDDMAADESSSAPAEALVPADEPVAGPFAFGNADASSRAASAAIRARRQPASIGVVGFLVGWLLSAVVGLSLGYLVLILIRGEEGDIFHLREKLRQVWPGGAVDRLPTTPPWTSWRRGP